MLLTVLSFSKLHMKVPVSESRELQSIDHHINFAWVESIDWNEMKFFFDWN